MTGLPKLDRSLDVLVRARALIADERNWCVFHLRQEEADGTVRFCARGAVGEALGVMPSAMAGLLHLDREFLHIDRLLAEAVGGDDVANYNNTHAHGEVLAMFDRAIARRIAILAA